MLSRLRTLAKKGFSFPGAGGGGYGFGMASPFGGLFKLLPSADHDYQSDAGVLWQNSVAKSCMDWKGDTFPEAPFVITKPNADGKRSQVFNHPAIEILNTPNKWYSDDDMWRAVNLSLDVSGNGYLYKLKGNYGEVTGFLYIPHWQIFPRWPQDGSKFISHYDYVPNGIAIPLRVENVIHFRLGLDPFCTQLGLSRFGAVLREICTENEAATFSAAMLRNSGVTSVIIQPEKDAQPIPDADRKKMLVLWQEKFSRDRAGEPFISSHRLDIKNPGWSPEQMVLDKIRGVPVSRICAAYGIDPLVLGLPSETNSTYGNRREATDGAWESCLIPAHRLITKKLNHSLKGEILGMSDDERFEHDYSDVRALQEDVTKKWERVANAYKTGVIKRKDALRTLGIPYDETADDIYFTDIQLKIATVRGSMSNSDSGTKMLAQGIEAGFITEESLLLGAGTV